jgi:hypothetical protein
LLLIHHSLAARGIESVVLTEIALSAVVAISSSVVRTTIHSLLPFSTFGLCAFYFNLYKRVSKSPEETKMYHFAFNGKGALSHTILNGAVVIESDESKSSWSSSLLIHH